MNDVQGIRIDTDAIERLMPTRSGTDNVYIRVRKVKPSSTSATISGDGSMILIEAVVQ